MRKIVLLTSALGVIAGCSSLTPTSDPVYLRITDLEARLIRIERQLENESLITLAQDIASLRNEVQQLLGQVETLNYDLENQAERQRTLYTDLDQRLSDLEAAQSQRASMPVSPAGVPGGISGGFPGGVIAATTLTDAQAYDGAFNLIGQRDYQGARAAFQAFLATYPASQRRANAQYWLAETYYAELNFAAALAEFQKVLAQYPQSDKVRDALVKIGFTQHELGNRDQARQALLQVIREYPGTTAASDAEARLQRIAAEN